MIIVALIKSQSLLLFPQTFPSFQFFKFMRRNATFCLNSMSHIFFSSVNASWLESSHFLRDDCFDIDIDDDLSHLWHRYYGWLKHIFEAHFWVPMYWVVEWISWYCPRDEASTHLHPVYPQNLNSLYQLTTSTLPVKSYILAVVWKVLSSYKKHNNAVHLLEGS